MKTWTPMIILFLAVTALIVWDSIYTHNAFEEMSTRTEQVYAMVSDEEINYNSLNNKLENLNNYWTKKMDVLCISISKKDLQPVSDYLQYLITASKNESADDCLTYARLLSYNLKGLTEANGITFTNLL